MKPSSMPALFALSLAAAAAHADVVLSGPDSNAGTYSSAALESFAAASGSVDAGGVTGVSLWGLLGGSNAASPTAATYGAITTSTPSGDNGKNAILRYYVLATGAGGAQAVVSLGEIDPRFGGTQPTPAFLAYASTGGGLLSAPELVVPGRATLSDVTSLQLLSAPALASGAGGVSTAVTLSGEVEHPGSYTAATLASGFAPVVESVAGDTYTGVGLGTFLAATRPVSNQIVVARGTDGYEVVFSLGELDPASGGSATALLAYADTGADFPADGVARTILPSDNAHGRWMSNLDAIAVVSAVPEPGTVSTLVAGLAAIGIASRRRRR